MIVRIILILTFVIYASYLYGEDKTASKPLYPVVSTSEKNNLTPFPGDERTRKIIKRHNLENEGWLLAKQHLFEEAIIKFRAAIDPSLINEEGEKVFALSAIRNIYLRQGKLNDALELHEKYILPLNSKKDSYIDADLELRALIKARDIKNNKPIYDHIAYIRTKYEKYIPPKGYSVPYDIEIDKLIHLYDYLHDYDSGITFIDEIIKYHTQHPDKNHRSAHAKDVREYTRVKQAWELDKKTGQHGHLREVIRTSDVISW